MKRELESIIMEELKKGYCPVYDGEEGYIFISMKAYLAAAEYAGAEYPCFWYDDLCYDMIDVESREDEIEGWQFNFMPRKIESGICPNPEGRSDDIFSDLEDIDLVYRAIDEKISNLGGAIYYLKSWREDLNEIRLNEKLEDLSKELNRYEAIFDRIVEYEKVRKQMEVKKE